MAFEGEVWYIDLGLRLRGGRIRKQNEVLSSFDGIYHLFFDDS